MKSKVFESIHKRFDIQNRSVIFTWLFSYITVLLVPVMISGIIYMGTAGVVREEINRANESVLMQLGQNVDNTLTSVEQIYQNIAFDKKIISYSNLHRPISSADRIDAYDIIKNLKTYVLVNKIISNIYIYYKNNDIVLSQNEITDSKTLYGYLWREEDISYDQWVENIGKDGVGRFTSGGGSLEDSKASSTVLFIGNGFDGSITNSGIAIIIEINGAKLLESIKNVPLAGNTIVSIIDDKDNIVASTRDYGLPSGIGFSNLTGTKGVLSSAEKEGRIEISYITSNVTGWKYASLIKSDVFWEKARYIRNLTWISFALCLLIGGAVTYVLLKRNYFHINSLVKSIANKAEITFGKGENEYRFIQDTLSATFDEKQKIGLKLKQQSNVVRSSFLCGLLKGRLNNKLSIDEADSRFGLSFDSGYYAVILFYLDDFSGLFADNDEMDAESKFKLLQFIITNVVEELAGQKHYGCLVETDNMQVCIVNLKGKIDGSTKQELRRIAAEAQQFLKEKFSIYMTISISDIHKDINGISEAYKESLEAMEYRIVSGSGEIICFKDIEADGGNSEDTTIYYPLLLEQKLINFLKSGDAENASAVLNDIFKNNFSKPPSIETVDIARCLMFDMISTMIKAIGEIQGIYGKHLIVEINPVQRLLRCHTIKEMKSELFNILQQLCEHIEADKKNSQFKLHDDIKRFIENNYDNQDLNISMVGEYFKMAPFYLSKLFKEKTGEGILEYISAVRINKAKKLLKEGHNSVQEVAQKVGYCDYNTFTRIFKKLEGIPPKKFREIT